MTTIDRAQAEKAVNALLKHHEKVTAERADTELLERDEHVWLVINTKRGSTKRKAMPKRIQLPNPPLPPPPATAIAIITKPPQRTYKDLLAAPEHNIKFINRVVDTDKLRGKWKPFEARRNLARENDLWLADERVIPSLPKLLGKVFFDAKKQPIPVNLQRKDLKAELGRAISSTYFHPSTGTSHSIRIATAGTTTAAHTLDNLLAATPLAVKHIEDEWENVLSVGIKTSSSVLLPIWSSKLEGRFDVKEKTKKDGDAAADADVEMNGAAKKSKGKGKGKDNKRSAPEAEDEEKVEKKAKASPVKKAQAAPVKEAKKVKASSAPVKTDRKKTSSAGDAGKRAKQAAVGSKRK